MSVTCSLLLTIKTSCREYDSLVEFGSTAGGTCAFHLDLFCVPVAVTISRRTGLATPETGCSCRKVFCPLPFSSSQQTQWLMLVSELLSAQKSKFWQLVPGQVPNGFYST